MYVELYLLFTSFACAHNRRAKGKGCLFFFAAIFLPAVMLANFLAVALPEEVLRSSLGERGTMTLKSYTVSGVARGCGTSALYLVKIRASTQHIKKGCRKLTNDSPPCRFQGCQSAIFYNWFEISCRSPLP